MAVPERRRYPRLAPSSPPLVLLDKSKYSLLVDLCEGGLAVGGVIAQNHNHVIPLEFDLPDRSECIHVEAEIVWTSDAGHRTGFRFLDLPENFRLLVEDWVSTASASKVTATDPQVTGPAHGPSTEETQTSSHPVGGKEAEKVATESSALPQLQSEPKWNPERFFEEQSEKFNSGGSVLHLGSIVIIVVVISSLMGFLLGYYWRGRRLRPRITPIPAAARPSEHPTDNSVSPPPPLQPQTAGTPVLSLDNPGFVLQVGAMKQEAKADALSNDLHKKNFSAFVFRRGKDVFYRVAVGPYADEGAATRIRNDLEHEGYKPIIRPWSPE